MEYQSMSRKELQSLCKKNGIPANTTNAIMAQSLAALLSSSTIEHDQSAKERDTRSSESEAAKESDNAEKEATLTTPAVGNRRASTRKLPISTCEKVAVRSTRKSASIMKEESDISDITQEQSLVKNKKKEATQEREEDLKAESKGQIEEGYTAAEVSDGIHQSSNETELGTAKQTRGRRGRAPLKATAVALSQKESGIQSSRSKTLSKAAAVLVSDKEEAEAETTEEEEDDEKVGKVDIGMDFHTPASALRNNLLEYSSMKAARKEESGVCDGRIDLEANLHTPAISRRDQSKPSEVPTTNPSLRRSSRRVGGGVSVSNSAASSSSSIKQKQASVAASVRMSARRRRPTGSVDSCIPKNPSVSDNEGDVEDNCNEKASQMIANADGRRRSARGKPPMNENKDSSTLKGSSERELAATIEKKTPYGRRITNASTKKGSASTVSELKKSVKFSLDTEERVPYEGDAVAVGNLTEKEALSSSKEVDTAILSMASEEGCLDSTLVNKGECNGALSKDNVVVVEVTQTGKEASSSSNEVDTVTQLMASVEGFESALITEGDFNEVLSKDGEVVEVNLTEKEALSPSNEVDTVIPSMASVEEFNGAPSEYDVVAEVSQMEKEASPLSKEVNVVIPSMISVEGLDSALVNEGVESNGAPSKDNIAVAVANSVEKEVLSSSNEVDTVIPSMASSAEEQFEGENVEQFVPNEDLDPSKNGVESDKSSLDYINKDSAVVNQREEEEEEEEVTENETAILSMVEIVPDQMPSVLPSPFEGENEEQFILNEELVQESDGKEDSAAAVGQIAMEEESLVNNSGIAIPSMVSCVLDASNGPIEGEMDEEQSAQLANDEAATAIYPSIPSHISEELSEAMAEEKVETSITFEAIEITEQIVLAEEQKGVENLVMSVTEETNVETESKEVSLSKEGLSEAMVEKEGNSEREMEMDYACLSLRKLRALCKQKGGRPLPTSTKQSNNAIAVKMPSEILPVENMTIPPSSSTEEAITNIAIELPTVILKASSTTENNYTKQTVSSSAKKNNKGFELSAKKTPSSISSSKRTPLQMLSSNVVQRSLSTNLLASFENGGSSPYLASSNDANNMLLR